MDLKSGPPAFIRFWRRDAQNVPATLYPTRMDPIPDQPGWVSVNLGAVPPMQNGDRLEIVWEERG